MVVKTQPTKLNYTEGEKLELAGLEVTLTDNQGLTKNVAFADFATYSITANPTDGTELKLDDDGKPISLTKGSLQDETANLTVNAKVTPQDPPVVGPVDPTDPNGEKPADPSKYWTVTFKSADETKGTVAAKNTVYVLKTEQKTLADITAPEKTAVQGYEFDKWDPALDANTTIAGDMIVKAYFKQAGTTPTPTPEPIPSYPRYEYNPFWHIYFGSGTAMTNKTVELQKKVVMKLQAKLVIGSKEMIKTVDGVEQKVMMDIAPFIESNRTMLPIRFVAEALGFKVEWEDATRTVILTDKGFTVKIPVDTNKIIVNGNEYESDVKPVLRNNRTMLPIGNIARALGLKDGTDIIWDGATRTVVIKREIEK